MQLNRPTTQRRLSRPNAGAAASGPKPGGPSFTTQAGGGNQFHPPSHPPRHHGDGIGYHVPGGVRPLGGGNGPSFAGAATAQAPNFGRVGAQQINPNAYAGNIPNLGTLSRAPVTPELVSTDLMDLDALEAGIINRADQQTARNRAMVLARSGGNLGGLGRLSYLAAEANPNEDLSRVRLSREQLRKNIESANADRTNQANQFNTGIEGEDFRINSGNRLAEAGLDQTNQGRAAGIAQGNQSANLSAAQANARLREAEWGARFQQDRASRGDFESDRGFDESQRRYDLDRQDRLDAQDDLGRLRRPGGRRLSRPGGRRGGAGMRYNTSGGGGAPVGVFADMPTMASKRAEQGETRRLFRSNRAVRKGIQDNARASIHLGPGRTNLSHEGLNVQFLGKSPLERERAVDQIGRTVYKAGGTHHQDGSFTSGISGDRQAPNRGRFGAETLRLDRTGGGLTGGRRGDDYIPGGRGLDLASAGPDEQQQFENAVMDEFDAIRPQGISRGEYIRLRQAGLSPRDIMNRNPAQG